MSFNRSNWCPSEIKPLEGHVEDKREITETADDLENFEDCCRRETADHAREVNNTRLQEIEDEFADCSKRVEDLEEKNPELQKQAERLAEEDDDFSDCARETEDHYVAEVTYVVDQDTDPQQAREDIQEAYDQCGDPADMEELKEKANENSQVQVVDAELIECPEPSEEETPEAREEEAQEYAQAQEALEEQQEKTEEFLREQELLEQNEQFDNTADGAEVIERTEETESEVEEVSEESEAPETEEVSEEPEAPETEEVPEEPEELESEAEVREEAIDKEDAKVEQPKQRTEETILTCSEVGVQVEELGEEVSQIRSEKELLKNQLDQKFADVCAQERGTEAYKQALNEYNELKDRNEDMGGRLEALLSNQEGLEQKHLELRQAQIEKGAETVAASAATIAAAGELTGRFDDAIIERRPDKKELRMLAEENDTLIRELDDQKHSLKLAMDAKMDEISDYVMRNDLSRYETSRDPFYQGLTEEYLAMKIAYDRVSYNAVKLDDNNRQISEALGREYVPVFEKLPQSPIAEVAAGTDDPEAMDYFPDKARTVEILRPFNQADWEKLRTSERKKAINALADYNAEVLGIQEKPRIVFYRCKDESEFGYYSAKQNAIYINSKCIGDAAETADTVAHEYRHKYQHERASKLSVDRDLEFRENFEDYIEDTVNYRDYLNQPVERDARAYAKAFRKQIDADSRKPEGIIDPELLMYESDHTELMLEDQESLEQKRLNNKAANREIGAKLVSEGLCEKADFGELDPRAAREVYNTICETKEMFSDLELKFVGSAQARNEVIAKELESAYFRAYRSANPDVSEEDLMPYVKAQVEEDMKPLEISETTIAQSLWVPTPTEAVRQMVAGYNGITINETYGADYDRFVQIKQGDVRAGWKPVGCDTPKATVDHELGHQIAKRTGAESDPLINELYKQFLALDEEKRSAVLSGYAAECVGEFIAESWSEYRNNPNCRNVARTVAERMIELYEEEQKAKTKKFLWR